VEQISIAIIEGQQLLIKNYTSANSQTVSDRIVEPMCFTDDYESISAFEVKTKQNKYFNIERMAEVEVLDSKMKYEKHHEFYKPDIFGFQGKSLNKEIEIQGLEQQAADKRIKNANFEAEQKKNAIVALDAELVGRKQDLKNKKGELESIIAETEKEEANLNVDRAKAVTVADERLVASYNRIRTSMKNGIGVAVIMRESCGGCFAGIPPQRQADIKLRKKIIVCENCGRVLVDPELAEEVAQ
jgi:hypothetical protein